jgi:hypothetical protein
VLDANSLGARVPRDLVGCPHCELEFADVPQPRARFEEPHRGTGEPPRPLLEFPSDDARAYAIALVAQSVEMGIDLVRPLPPIGEAEAVRLSGILHTAKILRPWFDGTEAQPDWKRLRDEFDARYPHGGEIAGLRLFMLEDRAEALTAIYDRLGGNDAA